MSIQHRNLSGADAVHPAWYVSASDPGAVGADKGWVDTSAGPPYQLKKRNTGNTAWEAIGFSAGEISAQDFAATGIAGAQNASRYIGAVTAGASPTGNTFAVGDYVVDRSGAFWVCITGGSPGTWVKIDKNPMTTVGDIEYGGTVTGGVAAPTRLAAGTSGQVLTANGAGVAPSWQTAVSGGGSGGGGSGALVPLQTIGPITSTQASFTLSAPPTGFRNLYIVWELRYDGAAGGAKAGIRFNSDASAIYDDAETTSSGGSSSTNQTSGRFASIPGTSAGAGVVAAGRLHVPDYLSTTFNKTWSSVFFRGADAAVEVASGQWRSTAAISTITLLPASGNFVVGSYACLYGEMDTAGVQLTPASNLLYDHTVPAGGETTVNTGTLSQAYRDLRVVIQGAGSTAATNVNLQMQVNGDTGNNYDSYGFQASQTSIGNLTESLAAAQAVIANIPASTAPASQAGAVAIIIPNYATATFLKMWRSQSATRLSTATGDTRTNDAAGNWRSTAAITSLLFKVATGDLAAGTTIRVYGEPVSAGGAAVGTGTRLRIAGNLSVANATATTVSWDTEDSDADNQHYTSAANLTGTVSKTAASQTVTGSGTAFLTELSIGQVISIPGTAAEKCVVIAIASNTSLTVSTALANTASGQTATRLSSPIVFRQPGFYTLGLNNYWASAVAGIVTGAIKLNDTTVIAQEDQATINSSEAVSISVSRQFQQWDFVEAVVTQTSGGALNLTADERTSFTCSGRPTVVVAVPYAMIQDQKASGTAGGTFTSGSYQTRTLQTVVNDSAGIATLASNQVTLGAGTYRVRGIGMAGVCNFHKMRVQNVTDAATLLIGPSHFTSSIDQAEVSGRFTLSGTKAIELQHRCSTTRATDGFGQAVTFGDVEVYAQLEIWKEG